MTTTEFDKAKARSFLQLMMSVMDGGALSLMCSIGHRTGLFDTMAAMEPATADEIAAAAGLAERPVREWLGAMTVGGFLEYDAETTTYVLPREHAGLLTRAAGTLNLANNLQFIAQLGKVEDDVVESFRTGAGVPYSRYDSFQRLMADVSTQRFDTGLIDKVIPIIPGAREALERGVDMADVGCGSGHALNLLAREFPNSRFFGFDLSAEGVERRAEAAELGNTNVTYEVRDVADLGEDDRFDIVASFDAIHDQARPNDVLAGIHRALHPGGRYLCVEPNASSHVHENFERAHATFLYAVSTMHCMQVSLAAEGEGLGAAWGRQVALERLGHAGFVDIEIQSVPHDRTNDYYVMRKPG